VFLHRKVGDPSQASNATTTALMPGRKRSRMVAVSGARPPRTGALRRAQGGSKNRTIRVPRNKLGFPTSMSTKLRFTRREDFDVVVGNSKYRTIRANDLYDPVYALGGSQPRGFDQFMAVYKVFTVKASKISCNFMFKGYDGPSTYAPTTYNLIKTFGYDGASVVPAQMPVVCGITTSTDGFGAGLSEAQMEKDRTSWKIITPQGEAKIVSRSLKVSDFFGKKALTGSEGYSGNDGAGPTEEVFYHIWAGAGTNAGQAAGLVTPVTAYLTVEYDVTFTDPKILQAS